MFNKEDCNYDAYRGLLDRVKRTGRYMDYSAALKADSFIVLRHDIEFSIERAHNIARIEAERDFKSSYFVQLTNNAYNALSKVNIDMLKGILEMGHQVGLHYHRNGVSSIDEVKKDLLHQGRVLSQFLNITVDRFSLHRPSMEHLRADIRVDGMMNTYGTEFFTCTDTTTPPNGPVVKYISDSNHQWKYGLPTTDYFNANPKIQILIHPLSWSENGNDHVDCFKEILEEKREEFINTVKNEWKLFHILEGKL